MAEASEDPGAMVPSLNTTRIRYPPRYSALIMQGIEVMVLFHSNGSVLSNGSPAFILFQFVSSSAWRDTLSRNRTVRSLSRRLRDRLAINSRRWRARRG